MKKQVSVEELRAMLAKAPVEDRELIRNRIRYREDASYRLKRINLTRARAGRETCASLEQSKSLRLK